MSLFRLLFLLIFLNTLYSCTQSVQKSAGYNTDVDSTLIAQEPKGDSLQKGVIIDSVICSKDKRRSYAAYIPQNQGGTLMGIVYFFDPHADGALPVTKYKSLADKFHLIFIGSNDSKNGNDWNQAESIWSSTITDVKDRFRFDSNRVYLCGFSGGAKVATFLALSVPGITGVIADGAVLPQIVRAGDFKFSFTGIGGNGDMNQSDLVATNQLLDQTKTDHRLILFDGKHEWAPQPVMDIAFAGWQLDAVRKGKLEEDTVFINEFAARGKQSIRKQIRLNKLLGAEEQSGLYYQMLNGLSNEAIFFKNTHDSLTNLAAYQQQSAIEGQMRSKEQSMKQEYEQHLSTVDRAYWSKTINEVHKKANTPNPEQSMYQRLDAYLSLAFYSLTSQMIAQNQNEEAVYFDNLYKKADPQNSEAWYFSAILGARKGNSQEAKADLLKAIALGFDDKKRLESEPEFLTPSMVDILAQIEEKIK